MHLPITAEEIVLAQKQLSDETPPDKLGLAMPTSEVVAQRIFETTIPRCMTTFRMPHIVSNNGSLEVANGKKIGDVFIELPFPCFRITATWELPPHTFQGDDAESEILKKHGASGAEELIIERVSKNTISLISKMRVLTPVNRTFFAPHSERTYKDSQHILELIVRLYNSLHDRKHKLVPEPVTRQVRRDMGVSKEYRELIVIGREDRRYTGTLTSRETMKVIRLLHPVRGADRIEHLRQLKSGEVIIVSASKVKPHLRGYGTHFQFKDYEIK